MNRVTTLLFLSFFAGTFALGEDLSPEEVKFFESRIRPVLVKECYGCHSNKTGNAKGGLRLDTRELLAVGGNSGSAVVAGEPNDSLLLSAMMHEDFIMPPKRKLADNVIEDFRRWIEMGAPDPRISAKANYNSQISDEEIEDAKSDFWAFRKPNQNEPPSTQNIDWSVNPIDLFVLARLESEQMKPSPDAASYQILRRLCFDLVGLPPTLEQIDYFDDAYKKDPDRAIRYVTQRLLDKPQFGERWGRHWLDVVRFAESNGREVNMTYPHAWRYRDYVIDSFNDDKPYDQFLKEQLAGDLLPAKDDSQWAEQLIATGFLAIGPKNLTERNRTQFTADLVDEQIDTTTRAFLGMSVACARCHDHKFDPIPQSDYYAMAGIFRSTATFFGTPASKYGNLGGVQNRNKSNLLRLPIDDPSSFDPTFSSDELRQMNEELDETIADLRNYRRDRMRNATDQKNAQQNFIRMQAKMERLSDLLGSVDRSGNPNTYCMGVQESDTVADTRLLVRGEVGEPAQVVPRGIPKVLSSGKHPIATKSSGRLEMANWIASKQNPLTARVMVNRIWQHLIGEGIVASTENFGSTGQAPTHPELLDYLASRFMDSNWSVKTMIGEIVSSRIYRTSSAYNQNYFEKDPDNHFLWRANPRRLDGEALRDAMLFVAGEMDFERPRASEVAKAGYMRVRDGNLFNPVSFLISSSGSMRSMAMNAMTGDVTRSRRQAFARQLRARTTGNSYSPSQSGEKLDMTGAKFRSVYMPVVRGEVSRSLEVFDFAQPDMVVGKRETSSTPNQALYMMNNDFVHSQSVALARRIMKATPDRAERLKMAFKLTYSREPNDRESKAIGTFVSDFATDRSKTAREVVTSIAICQSLFASAEFRYLD